MTDTVELYTTDLVSNQTMAEAISDLPVDNSTQSVSGVTSEANDNVQVNQVLINGSISGASYKSSNNEGRVEIFPTWDKTIGFISTADNGNVVFETFVAGSQEGDVVIGNYAGGQGILWDQSAGTLSVLGGISVSHLDIPDTVTANSFHVDIEGNAWWGSTTLAGATVAKILKDGSATFSMVKITGLQSGSALDGQYISDGTILAAKVNKAIQDWTQTSIFSSTDSDTVSWGTGSLIFTDGTSYSISAGNTGNMSVRTYIYFDVAVSTTAYQYTTTASTAVGNGKVLVATAINDTASATFEVFGGNGGLFINGNIIAANSVVANQLSVSTLSAITANMGAITAGTITLDTSGYIRGGQTDYNTGIGFFLGYSGAYKFSIGDPAGNHINWDGSILEVISNSITYNNGVINKDVSDASTTLNIAHGFGRIPKFVRFNVLADTTTGSSMCISQGIYNGTTTSTIYSGLNGSNARIYGTSSTYVIYITGYSAYGQIATVTVDATNIILVWTKVGSLTGNAVITWEAY